MNVDGMVLDALIDAIVSGEVVAPERFGALASGESTWLLAKDLEVIATIAEMGRGSALPTEAGRPARIGRFELGSPLGAGGMGTVWEARDTTLERTVAIKFLHPHLAGEAHYRERFLREGRAVARLHHRGICAIYEVGELPEALSLVQRGQVLELAPGTPYAAIELIRGETLQKRLRRGGGIPQREVLRIATEAADALAAAHDISIVHRDIKPANIMLGSDGRVVILDFGLAGTDPSSESISPSGDDGPRIDSKLTMAGNVVGTIAYMSPEQARGDKLDARTDVFSFGLVLWEMLTGAKVEIDGSLGRKTAITHRAASTTFVPDQPQVPKPWRRFLQRCIAADAGDRYSSAKDLRRDLRARARSSRRALAWSLVGGVTLAVLSVGGWFGANRWRGSVDAQTILILPLQVRGQAEGTEFAGRAFAEALAVNLAEWKNLRVLPVPETAEFASQGGSETIDAAIKLGAGRLLSGALTRSGRQVHASLSLIDTERNRILWGSQRDDDAGSLPGLAASLSRAIAEELGTTAMKRYDFVLNLIGSSPAMVNTPATAEAVGALKRFEIQHALDVTQRLVSEFPNESDAFALRLCAVFYAYARGLPGFGRNVLEGAMADLTRIDPDNPMPDNVRCELFVGVDNEASKAIEYASRHLAREDLTPAARAWLLRDRAGAKNLAGDSNGGIDDINEAYKLDPTNHYNSRVLGDIRWKLGDLGGAEIAYRQCVALAPEFEACHWALSRVLQREGRWAESVEAAKVDCTLSRRRSACATYSYVLLKAGMGDKARAAAASAAGLPGNAADGADDLARVWALLGDRAEALRLLRALAAADSLPSNLLADQDLAALRDDPEFRALASSAQVGKQR